MARAVLCLFVLLLAACTAHRHIDGNLPEEARVELEAPAGQILRLETPAALTAAKSDGSSLLISYQANGQTGFGRATADDKQDISVHAGWFPVHHLSPVDADSFAAPGTETVSIAMLQADTWQAFKTAVYEEYTPREPGNGVVLNYRDVEYFWYRTEDGELAGTDLMDKPAGIPIANIYRLEAMADSLLDTLERFLAGRGNDDRKMVIATGETGPYARPFVYIDLDKRRFGFISLEPFTFGSAPTNYVATGGKLGDHLVRSFVFDAFNRPTSYVSRLFYFLTDSITGLSRRVYVNRFAYPDIEGLEIPPLNSGPGMDLEEWEARLDRLFGKKRYSGTIELLVDGDSFFPRLIDSVIEARESVKMRTYIYDDDDYAVAIADLLKRRSQEIDVSVMMDGLGTLMAEDASAGTTPEGYNAPAGITTYLKSDSQISVHDLTNPWMTGDHTKTTIIDSNHAYIGGMNIGREYRWEWHDMMMRVEGEIVAYIEREFDKAWAQGSTLGDVRLASTVLSHPRPESETIAHPIRPLLTLPRISEVYRAQLEAIRNSRSYIYVQNAYLSDAVAIHELAMARLRGVDVRVIIPMEGNHGIMNANNVLAANTLLKYGVRVFVYPGMSHIKAAIYDDWACVGSANFDKLSFQVNKEMNLGSSDPAFVRQLKDKVFDPDFSAAEELEKPLPAGWKNTFASIVASQL